MGKIDPGGLVLRPCLAERTHHTTPSLQSHTAARTIEEASKPGWRQASLTPDRDEHGWSESGQQRVKGSDKETHKSRWRHPDSHHGGCKSIKGGQQHGHGVTTYPSGIQRRWHLLTQRAKSVAINLRFSLACVAWERPKIQAEVLPNRMLAPEMRPA